MHVCVVRLQGVQQLSVVTSSNSSVEVRWQGVNGARGYRLVWGPFIGEPSNTLTNGFRGETVLGA